MSSPVKPAANTSQDPRSGGKWKRWLVTAGMVAGWYTANIGVILQNKFLLSFYGFKFPVLLTLLHMVGCSFLTAATAFLGLMPLQAIQTRQQFFKVALLSLVFTVTIILGNASLKYIPVSFNQAIGATTPLFTALLGFLIQGTRESFGTYMALIPVVLGIIIATGFEPSFHLLGFIVCVGATALRGFKTVFQGVLLSEPSEKLDSFSLLAYMSPLATLWLVPTTAFLEPESVLVAQGLLAEKSGFLHLIVLSCSLAFFANLLNFLVTKHTSPLTLQVLGNVKGVVATVVSVTLFRNTVTLAGCFGYGVAIGGVFLYGDMKRKSKLLAAAGAAKNDESPEKSLLDAGAGRSAGSTAGASDGAATSEDSPLLYSVASGGASSAIDVSTSIKGAGGSQGGVSYRTPG